MYCWSVCLLYKNYCVCCRYLVRGNPWYCWSVFLCTRTTLYVVGILKGGIHGIAGLSVCGTTCTSTMYDVVIQLRGILGIVGLSVCGTRSTMYVVGIY